MPVNPVMPSKNKAMEASALIIGGGFVGAGLVSMYYGKPFFSLPTFLIPLGGGLAGYVIPGVPGAVLGGIGAAYLLKVPMSEGALTVAGSVAGTIAGMMLAVKEITM